MIVFACGPNAAWKASTESQKMWHIATQVAGATARKAGAADPSPMGPDACPQPGRRGGVYCAVTVNRISSPEPLQVPLEQRAMLTPTSTRQPLSAAPGSILPW